MKKQKMMLTLATIALTYFGLLAPKAFGVNPPPDGCYPGFTTAEGCNALKVLTTGSGNTGLGWYALSGTSTGSFNTGVGAGALALNITDSNTAVGTAALLLNTTGNENVAVGTSTLLSNDTGIRNSALGAFALSNNIGGSFNSALGRCALLGNIDGNSNTALGAFTLLANVSGINNTAVGDSALNASTGDNNIALGANAGTDPEITNNNVYVGDPGFPGDENVISIGGIAASGTPYALTFIGGIYGSEVNTDTALPVYVDTDGHLGTNPVNGSGKKMRMRSPQGAQPQANVNEFQKQQKRIAELENTVARLVATVKDQAAQIEKVSARLELRKPGQRVVVNKK